MKAKYLPLFCAAALWASASTGFAFSHPVLLQDQGSFFAGGAKPASPRCLWPFLPSPRTSCGTTPFA